MKIGTQILDIRKKEGMTQEQFGALFHVTRQTVSNWENEKSYPDLQLLVDISERFHISLDQLIKENPQMVETMDQERTLGAFRHEKNLIGMFTGAGMGILASCIFSPDSLRRWITIGIGLFLLSVGGYKRARYDRQIWKILDNS